MLARVRPRECARGRLVADIQMRGDSRKAEPKTMELPDLGGDALIQRPLSRLQRRRLRGASPEAPRRGCMSYLSRVMDSSSCSRFMAPAALSDV